MLKCLCALRRPRDSAHIVGPGVGGGPVMALLLLLLLLMVNILHDFK